VTIKSRFGDGTSALDAPVSQPHHGHGILHNLLADAVDTAKGIPFGIVQTAEHPIRSVKLMGQSYADEYGHGFNHFWHSFKEHPLQPLLDAISVPLLLAGGAGVAVKGASAAAEIGAGGAEWARTMEAASVAANAGKFAEADALRASVANSPKLMKAAQRFQKGTAATTRVVESPSGLPMLARTYSSNLFRRALTKGADNLIEGTLGKIPSKSGVPYFSEAGLAERTEAKHLGQRVAATTGRQVRQARGLIKAEKRGIEPALAGDAMIRNFKRVVMDNGIKLDKAGVEKVLAKDSIGRQRWSLIQAGTEEAHKWERGPGGALEHKGTETVASGEAKMRDVSLSGYETGTLHDFIKTRLPSSIKLTKNIEHGLQDEHGYYTLVRDGSPEAYVKEIERTHTLLKQVAKNPVRVWKLAILGFAPRYFVNNVVGNSLMYAAATNPVEFTRGVYEAIRSAHGIRAAAKFEKAQNGEMAGIMAKLMPEEFVDEQMGYLQHGAMALEGTAAMTRNPLSFGAKTGLFGVTEKVAYRATQRASILGAVTTLPDFRKLFREYRRQGMARDEAFQKATRTLTKDPRMAAAIEKRVTDWAGQYYHLNGAEKMISALVPFYNWDRHALRFGKEQVLSRPVRTIVLSQLGALGDSEAKRELGNLPDFMKGAVPLRGHEGGVLGLLFGQQIRGRQKIALTAGYNPLAAAADDATALAALVGAGPKGPREALGSQLNPVVSGAIGGITGEQLFSGAQAKGLELPGGRHVTGPVGEALNETFAQLPQVKLAKTEFGGAPSDKTKKGDPTLYTKDVRQQLSSLFGFNERDYSPEAAAKLYREEHHIKKGRRRKKKNAAAMASSLKSNF
jgi:hypothetical protein